MGCCGDHGLVVALKGEHASQRAIDAVFVGMGAAVAVEPADWPNVREVLSLQAVVWDSEGKHALANAARAVVARLDIGE